MAESDFLLLYIFSSEVHESAWIKKIQRAKEDLRVPKLLKLTETGKDRFVRYHF